ncbi:RNA 3'-phosphate cyclase, partial [Candidatus Woesearchaeota archaeon]|nr:RNA 3'-phosphate cyclase [Candidatus Woesearchaeota archaeon]
MIILDGNYGEGGGALVRTALALSALTGQEFKVTNIRAGRADSGLKPQHLTAIKTLKEFCHAEINNIDIGSTELHFKPGKIKKGIYDIDIGTAG